MIVVKERVSDEQKMKRLTWYYPDAGRKKGAGTMRKQEGERYQGIVDAGPRKS